MTRTPLRALRDRARSVVADERGDVPGWVLITLMTAGLVLAIWAIAGNVLGDIFETALRSVVGGP